MRLLWKHPNMFIFKRIETVTPTPILGGGVGGFQSSKFT